MKYHRPLQPTTPLPYTNNWIDMRDKPIDHFNEAEEANILLAKKLLQDKLETFNMTVGKLGPMHEHSYFVAGGAIGSLLRGEEPNDYDIYFFDGVVANTIFNLYEKDPSYQNEVAVMNEKYRDIIENNTNMIITENATTLKNGLQLIRKHYGEPGAIRKTFDFVHCLPYYDSRWKKLIISKEQYDLNMKKKLVRNNNNLFQPHREQKFLDRGWTWQWIQG